MASLRFNVTIDSTGHGYTGGGTVNIFVRGITSLDWDTKRNMIKTSIPKTTGSVTQTPDQRVYDLKRTTEQLSISGFLEDDATETAWNKFWKLRAVCTRGGKMNSLTFYDIAETTAYLAFPDASTAINYYPWLENITATWESTGDLRLDSRSYGTARAGIGRIRVKIVIIFGSQLGGS